MANPYHHAISSAETFGGKPSDYYEIHSFLDSSKAHIATFKHRALLHNDLGIYLCYRIFKDTPNVEDIAMQHIEEDLGKIPLVEDLFCNYKSSVIKTTNKLQLPSNENMSRIFKTDLTDFITECKNISSFFNNVEESVMFFNSFGIFILEKIFGIEYKDTKIPTRIIAERYVLSIYRDIFSVYEVIKDWNCPTWIGNSAKPLSKETK